MIKEHTVKNKLKKHLSFYLVLAFCMIMISLACWFAYTQTQNQLVVDLDSAVGEIKVDVPKSTEPPTEPETKPETETEEIRKTPVAVEPLDTVPIETQLITQEVAVIDAPETAPAVPETTAPAVPTAGKPLFLPLKGQIIQEFSNGELVKSETTGIWQTHNGIDIAGNPGDPVYAAGDGIVESIENDALWGVTITIDHQNGYKTRYCNLNNGLQVLQGDKVESGKEIGAVGDTADIESSMPSHLHFEFLKGDVYLNPADYFGTAETTP